MLACITACVWLESAALPVQAEHYAVLYITFTGRCTHPQPTYVLARILLSSRALLAGITLLQLPCSTVLCLSDPVLAGYINKSNLRLPPQSSTCSHTENLNLKNQITTDSGVPNAAKIIRRCQDCQGPQVVIDKRDQGILSKSSLVLRPVNHWNEALSESHGKPRLLAKSTSSEKIKGVLRT